MEIACLAFSATGIRAALTIRKSLGEHPWNGLANVHLAAPAALLARSGLSGSGIQPYKDLNGFLASIWCSAKAIIFVGAAGIAIRAVAPMLRHKSIDPAVVGVDAAVRFAISLLSGHWGGGNSLAAHLARLLACQAVITTASDASGELALDLALQASGLKILDWDELPALQGRLLEGECLSVHDPWRALSPQAQLVRKTCQADISIHWRRQIRRPGVLRAAVPAVHIGIGLRKGCPPSALGQAFTQIMETWELEPAAIAALATVDAKVNDPALLDLSRTWRLTLLTYPPDILAAIATPNPSQACAKRFGTPPFSVCEAAALAAARAEGRQAFLLAPKTRFAQSMTFAIAVRKPFSGGRGNAD